ncbi:AI-2 transport protein TqsA [Pontiella desulfatans]|uniref:AI-2 transport protein TqsA n=1 Tax=Pontiella desulfatans TaxID=2750659 RepID=A0A6C2U877_PONDE|nr:AI-2E family transporter [Pontiella desulfatans]VGO16155.1 AI-2 transport protein TqsA [Pontiella desulfatans]
MKRSNLMVGLLSLLAVFAVAAAFKVAQTVVIPLMIAWLLSYICGPVVNYLVHKRVPLGLAVFFVLVLVLFVCYLGGVFLGGRVRDVLSESPRYISQLNAIYQDATANLDLPEDYLADINWTQQLGPKVAAMSVSVAGFMGNFLGKLTLVLIFLVFMLLGKPYFKYKVAAAFPARQAVQFTEMTASISKQIGQYLVVKVAISGTTGVLVWLALTLLQVEFSLTWGALAFFLNFIPSIGSILASIPPILLSIVQYYPSVWTPIFTAIVLLLIQMTMGNVIEPKIMGDSLNLSPVVILLSLIFFGWMWGMTGALLSVPIAAAIKIVCENIDALKPISILMGSGKQFMKDHGA